MKMTPYSPSSKNTHTVTAQVGVLTAAHVIADALYIQVQRGEEKQFSIPGKQSPPVLLSFFLW